MPTNKKIAAEPIDLASSAAAGEPTAATDATHVGSATPLASVVGGSVGASFLSSREDHKHPPGAGATLLQTASADLAGNISTTSSTLVDMAGLSVTITTAAGFLLVWFSASVQTSAAGNVARLALLVDGVQKKGSFIKIGGGSGGALVYLLRIAVAAGSHTVKTQWRTSAGTVSCSPVTSPDDDHAELLVAEVSA